LKKLRASAIAASLFPQTTLKHALERMGFVQADPIQAPARAQDLILRHRVESYRAGGLDRDYPALDIEEDVLYAYGFVPRHVWQLLQPRQPDGLGKFEKRVLDAVKESGETHPKQLQSLIGRRRVINPWGGYSAATTQALEQLRHRGLLRIARRERGVRIYEQARPYDPALTPPERLRRLILLHVRVLAPSPERSLRAGVARYRRWGNPRTTLDALLRGGELERETVDGVSYIFPARSDPDGVGSNPRKVRFLAPFDPVVWDRSRFEHFWGWSYRFEAYTPPAKRVRGYYAMPLLWGDQMIGWSNVTVNEKAGLNVDLGFVEKRPTERAFCAELEREVESVRGFLNTWS
jgi:uncharacterized protein YcaQ